MRSLTNTVAALLMAVPVAVTAAASAQEVEERSGPVILDLEGGTVERSGDVKVIRGSAIRPEPVAAAFASKAVPHGGIEVVGGDRLWLVDHKAGEVTGCILALTIYAGAPREVRCTTERLP